MDRPVGVVGGGTMGLGVAQSLATAGHPVVVLDPADQVRATGSDRLRDGLRLAKLLGRFSGDHAEVLSSVRWTAVEKDLDDVQFVVECGPERIPLKQELFRMLDAVCPPDAVLASCTSAIPIGLLAACTGRPELVLGMHFMNPAPLKPVVEVARTEQTGADTLRRADELLAGMGKRGIVVRDAPGFVSNRVLMSTINDAATVVQEGTADPATVDKVFEDCFGHRMGPLRTADLIGLDTILDTLHVLLETTGDDRFTPCELLVGMVREGRLGKKSGGGFFR
ncbi:3-hydroxyacyl-CoA dehydrogenase family protein [Kutzneria kofuensis]|uniref:3-hydroxybutyryl-CoA dehydrogenase n=1 Tax=Kutzneria kofuensis TaxID=103725 RepID=A0A7W9KSK1_9PSEU|nr:3-hydroxyacyl-CoA dehydrogenase family protein [Kutzneria kofuensis]MBB5897880.1 3-hydroxybutyryl-CoA dehydrogenase [Kutzneria kofuensis]